MEPSSPRRGVWWRRSRLPFVADAPPRPGRWHASWLLPTALMAAIVLGDWNTTAAFRIASWIVLCPALAAAVCGVVATALFAVAAVVFYVLLDLAWAGKYQKGTADLILVTIGGGLSVLASWLRGRAQRLLLRIENAAEATRLAVLRPLPAEAAGLESAEAYLAADQAARVGGDFFDIQPSPHGPRVLLGDVQGKGTTAVDAAAAVLGAFREAAYYEADLAVVAERLESRMRRHNRYMADLGQREERFATAVLVAFPPRDTGWVEVVNFGHWGPLAVGRHGMRKLPEAEGLPLGMSDLVGELPPVRRVAFAREDTLLMVTDGVIEARDRAGRFLPLAGQVTAARDTSPAGLVRLVTDAVRRHTGGRLADDTAILAVRRRATPGGGTAPGGAGDEGTRARS